MIRVTRRQQGFTLVELLVAAALTVIVLGIVGVYFARQAAFTRDTQTRSQVQDTARMLMQTVTNDLLATGAKYYVSSPSSGNPVSSALSLSTPVLSGADGGNTDSVAISYGTNLRASGSACRNVSYRVTTSGTLERRDAVCGDTTTGYSALADNVLAFDLVYVCSDAPTDRVAEPSQCPQSPIATYVRSVLVGIMVASDNRVKGATNPAPSYESPIGNPGKETCPDHRVCAVLTQEVQTPNLKDR